MQIITWTGLRVAIIVGLDVEYTRLWSKLGRLNLDLILVPAKTVSSTIRSFSSVVHGGRDATVLL